MTRKLNPGKPFTFPPAVQAPDPRPAASVITLLDKNASVAHAQVNKWSSDFNAPARYNFKVSGSSKREQGDVYDEDTGEILALAKAFQKLSQEMFSEASRRVEVLAAEQEKALVRSAERKLRKSQPPKPGRPREEWEAMKHVGEKTTRWGSVDGVWLTTVNEAGRLTAEAPEAPVAEPRRIPLANGQVLVIHPNRVEFRDKSGWVVRTVDRTP